LICGASDFFFLTKTKLYMKAFQIYFIVKTILNSNKKVYTYNQINPQLYVLLNEKRVINNN